MAAVPRNFKLLDELEAAEKSSAGGADISLGLSRPDDTFMHDWQASIVQAPGGGPDLRIWFLSVYVDDKYPTVPPAIKFSSKINLDCVDARGNVLPARMPYLASWNSSKSIMGALNELKALIARAPRAQPADDATY